MLVPVMESSVLPEELHLSKGEQMDKNLAQKQDIKNNQRIFGKVIAGTYAVVCSVPWIANCGRKINRLTRILHWAMICRFTENGKYFLCKRISECAI